MKKMIDPVCGMDLRDLVGLEEFSYQGNSLFFCGKYCLHRFKDNPRKFEGKPLIELKNIYKSFVLGDIEVKVLLGLNFYIWEGDFVAIIGASGSGKSTVLNMLGLLDRPTLGQIFLNGHDLSLLNDSKRAQLRSETFGFVFQHYNLIPWLTAYENVTLPLIFAGKNHNENELKAKFKEIGLTDRMNHRSFELSGGEQQRVALLRALSNDPTIIIGDEPTGNLDSNTGEKILKMLMDLSKIHHKTLIIVTHDAGIAEKADQVITLKDGQLVRNHAMYKKIYTE